MQEFFLPNKDIKNKKTAYINARLIDPATGLDINGALLTDGQKIADFGPGLFSSGVPQGIDIIDCKNSVLCPGLLDIQVHFRVPGQEYKEDIATGTKAAAAGGVTTVVCMANTIPTIDSPDILTDLYKTIAHEAYVKTYSYAAITMGIQGFELTDMQHLKYAGAIGFSDDGKPVMNSLIMRRAMEQAARLGMVIAQHAEDVNLSDGGCINEGKISRQLRVKGIPNASEAIIVERDLLLLELTGGHYHVLHISTHQAIDAVRRAKAKGLNVTCEVAPHHFILTDEAVLASDTMAKMNPPLRTQKDIDAILAGLKDGTIDAIATDHAPHDDASKNVHLSDAAFGIVGLETMLPLALELYHKKILSLSEVLAKMTYKAADIIHQPQLGRLKIGNDADLTILDPDMKWQISPQEFSSKSKNSPFVEYTSTGRALRTIVRGQTVYKMNLV